MADLSSYTPIYVRTTGDDDTGDGSSGSPYATAQKAFDEALAAGSGDYVLDLGVGSFGGVTLTADWPSRIAVRGAGATDSFLGGINGNGAAGVFDWDNNVPISASTAGFNVTLVSDNTVNLGDISCNGGQGGGGPGVGNGAAGGVVTLTDCTCLDIGVGGGGGNADGTASGGGGVVLENSTCANINASGGVASSTNPAAGGSAPGGSVTLTGSTCASINCAGGYHSSGDSPSSSGGNVSLTDSTCTGNISNSGGVVGSTSAGSGGSTTLDNSTCGNITGVGGFGSMGGTAGNGGTISIINDSQFGDIDVSGGYPGGGNGGAITVISSVGGIVTTAGGDGVYQADGVNGTITQTNSTFGTWLDTFYLSGSLTTLNKFGTGAWNNDFYLTRNLVGAVPSTIHVQTTGSNTIREDAGTESEPFATAQYAYNLLRVGTTGNRVLQFGAGSFGGVTLSDNWPSRISVRGAGATQSFLGGINGDGADQVWDYDNNVEVSPPGNGYSVTLVSDKTVSLGMVSVAGALNEAASLSVAGSSGTVLLTDCVAGNIVSTGGQGEWGAGSGGSVTLINCVTGSCYVDGGLSYSGDGGNAGAVSATDSRFDGVSGIGGDGAGNGGNGANVTLVRSTSTSDFSLQGGGTEFGSGGNGGSVTMTDSAGGNIASIGGGRLYGGQGGSGGAISLTDSTAGYIQANAGSAEFPGAAGTITITRGQCGDLTANGADGDQGKGGSGGGSITLTDTRITGDISSAHGSNEHYDQNYGTLGESGTVTLAGDTNIPDSIVCGALDTTDLRKGRGVNGSSILGLI